MSTIPYDDFIDIHDTISGIKALAFRLNNELGYTSISPFEEELTGTLEKLYKYAPDQFFIEVAENIIQSSGSSNRAERVLIKTYKLEPGKACEIVNKAWEAFNGR